MPERRIKDSEYSSLPTPIVSDGTGGSKNIENSEFAPQLRDIGKILPEGTLLPTPKALDGYKGDTKPSAHRIANGWFVDLPNVAIDLMPTPTSRDHKDGQAEHQRNGKVQTDTMARTLFSSGEILLPTVTTSEATGAGKHGTGGENLRTVVSETNWGKFEPAIRRWEEVLGRPAPAPTKPDGKDGAHRLSSAFTEWMMGVPEGWITDCGLSRNEELKACGNGVVPQQAELALRMLLDGIDLRIEAGGGYDASDPNGKRHLHRQPKKHSAEAGLHALGNASASREMGS